MPGRIENVLESYNWKVDERFDNKTLDYNKEKHNWTEYFFEAVRELKPELPDLTLIHKYFKPTEFINLRKHLELFTNSKEFSTRLDSFFADYICDLVDDPSYLIQSTSGIRFVVPNQDELGRLLAFHTGYWTGYNNHMGTVWIPLTKTYGTNTMQVVSWDDSIEIMNKIHNEQLPLDEIQRLSIEKSYPVEIDVGQAWLFNQGHVHGNINNETDITRVSFDARYALPGHDLGPRRAGSFYRLQGHYSKIDTSDLATGPWVVFVDQNSSYIGETPHFIIREFLLGKARQLNLNVVEWSNEYWGCTWMPKLQDFVERDNISGLIVPSIHAFSGTKEKIKELFEQSLKSGQQILFADENILLKDEQELEVIFQILNLEK